MLPANAVTSVVRRLSLSEPSSLPDSPSPPPERQQASFTDRLSVPIASAIRRLSIGSQDGGLHDQQHNRQPNEYFQQIHLAQNHQQDRSGDTNGPGIMSGIKDRLSPSAIGSAIRRLSGYDTDLRTELPQHEYLQKLHAQAIAEQNRNERQDKAREIVHGIKDRLGTAIRRLSIYEDNSSWRMTPHEYFTMFQADSEDNAESASARLPEIVVGSESGGESDGKRRSGWKKFNLFRSVISSMSNKPAKAQIPRAVRLQRILSIHLAHIISTSTLSASD